MNKILALMLIAAFAVVAGCAKAPAMEEETTVDVEATAPAMEAEATAPAMEEETAPAMEEETAPAVDASAATEVEVY